jgi:transposase
MINFSEHTKVYLAAGATDMRKSIDGLMVLVQDRLEADPFSCHLFVFCNRARDKLKILYWQRNGFWLFYRRLERERFWWPGATDKAALDLSVQQLGWLLEGLDITQMTPHRAVEQRLF